mmetsp:Transcript_50728/g.120593  ORF Transcript_50728/g.120593 Transcript_50728/m.120593 type:complete len:174 (-) Transcript_50728:151-672(-)
MQVSCPPMTAAAPSRALPGSSTHIYAAQVAAAYPRPSPSSFPAVKDWLPAMLGGCSGMLQIHRRRAQRSFRAPRKASQGGKPDRPAARNLSQGIRPLAMFTLLACFFPALPASAVVPGLDFAGVFQLFLVIATLVVIVLIPRTRMEDREQWELDLDEKLSEEEWKRGGSGPAI